MSVPKDRGRAQARPAPKRRTGRLGTVVTASERKEGSFRPVRYRTLEEVRRVAGLGLHDMADFLGVSDKTLRRRADEGALDARRPLAHLDGIEGYERVKEPLAKIEYGMYRARACRVYDQDAPWAKQAGFDPLDGEGAMHGSARWHHEGTRVAFAACVGSLALLEILVHVKPEDHGEKTLLAFDVPDDAVETLTHARLMQLVREVARQASERMTLDPRLRLERLREPPNPDTDGRP